jgi:serine/threonine-protein kinase RsbW
MAEPTNVLAVTVPSDTRYLHALTHLAQNAAAIAGFDTATSRHIGLAVVEALSNVIEHAYGGDSSRSIDVQFRILPEGIEVRVIHEGTPIDQHTLEEVERRSSALEVRTGGYGVILMRRLMDRVQYGHTEDSRHQCCLAKYHPLPSQE